MKKRILSVVLVLVLLLTGCAGQKPKQTKTPEAGETVSPGETTAPAEITSSPETTAPTEDASPTVAPAGGESPVDTPEERPVSPDAQGSKPSTSTPVSSGTQTAGPATSTGNTQTATNPNITPDTSTAGSPGSSATAKPGVEFPAPTDNEVLFFFEDNQNIGIGDTVQAEYFYNGTGRLTSYASHPGGIAVDQKGNVKALFEGNFNVYVTDGTYTASTAVWVPGQWWGEPHNTYYDRHFLELEVGKSKLIPANQGTFFSGSVNYKSSNPAVAKVDYHYITAVSPGTAIITAYTGYTYAKMIVTVKGEEQNTEVEILESSVSLYAGETVKLDYKYSGTGKLEWSSSNSYIARVDENGLVTAVRDGSCDIYLSDGTFADKCEITVDYDPSLQVTELKIGWYNGQLYDGVTKYKGDYLEFQVWNKPNYTNRHTYVESSDPRTVSVHKSTNNYLTTFRLNFRKAGTCTIKVISGDKAVTNTYTIHIKEKYDFAPDSGTLTVEEYIHYCNAVLAANGADTVHHNTGYLMGWYTDDEFTWEQAKKAAEGWIHTWWYNAGDGLAVSYGGRDEDGRHILHWHR